MRALFFCFTNRHKTSIKNRLKEPETYMEGLKLFL